MAWKLTREQYRKAAKLFGEKVEVSGKITFSFNEELGVEIEVDVNDEFVDLLVKEGIINEKSRNDEVAIRLALVALADEVTNSIVDELS